MKKDNLLTKIGKTVGTAIVGGAFIVTSLAGCAGSQVTLRNYAEKDYLSECVSTNNPSKSYIEHSLDSNTELVFDVSKKNKTMSFHSRKFQDKKTGKRVILYPVDKQTPESPIIKRYVDESGENFECNVLPNNP